MKAVKEEDFRHISDLEVVHRPTGTNVSTYRYTNPAEACASIHVNFGTADDDYDQMEIIRVACELLGESARRK